MIADEEICLKVFSWTLKKSRYVYRIFLKTLSFSILKTVASWKFEDNFWLMARLPSLIKKVKKDYARGLFTTQSGI